MDGIGSLSLYILVTLISVLLSLILNQNFEFLTMVMAQISCQLSTHDSLAENRFIRWYLNRPESYIQRSERSLDSISNTIRKLLKQPAMAAGHVSTAAIDPGCRVCLHLILTNALLNKDFVLRRAEISDVVQPYPAGGFFVSLQLTTSCVGGCNLGPKAEPAVSDLIF